MPVGNFTCTGVIADFGIVSIAQCAATPHAQTSPLLVNAYEAEFDVEICTIGPGTPSTDVGP